LNGRQKISSTTVIPPTYALNEQPLGRDNLTSHVDMCQSNCVYHVLMGDSNKFQILIIMTIKTTPNFCKMTGKGWSNFFSRNSTAVQLDWTISTSQFIWDICYLIPIVTQ
jgi:hypothetical protein